jgi:L-galactono-1,4-lactone dehydrogenase
VSTVVRYDEIVSIDTEARTVRVQAGARVSQVVDALREHGLTLENYASIREQQIGGFIQVGAHGTGAAIPPVDEQVISIQLVTPGRGTLTLSEAAGGELFRMARLGLGALGVVTEVTLRCVPRHQLVEETAVITRADAREGHAERLRCNKHVR